MIEPTKLPISITIRWLLQVFYPKIQFQVGMIWSHYVGWIQIRWWYLSYSLWEHWGKCRITTENNLWGLKRRENLRRRCNYFRMEIVIRLKRIRSFRRFETFEGVAFFWRRFWLIWYNVNNLLGFCNLFASLSFRWGHETFKYWRMSFQNISRFWNNGFFEYWVFFFTVTWIKKRRVNQEWLKIFHKHKKIKTNLLYRWVHILYLDQLEGILEGIYLAPKKDKITIYVDYQLVK